jgi:hypothetical protein
LPASTRNATSRTQCRSIARDERTPTACAYISTATIIAGSNAAAP